MHARSRGSGRTPEGFFLKKIVYVYISLFFYRAWILSAQSMALISRGGYLTIMDFTVWKLLLVVKIRISHAVPMQFPIIRRLGIREAILFFFSSFP